MIQLNPLSLCRADLPAPALSRGMGILLYLAQREAATLEQIASDLEIPKASAFRLLQTLEACNALHKTPQRTYELLLTLQPATDPLTIFRTQLESRLASLCQQTDCTVEWYEPSKEGMVLTLQKQPDTELCVQARPGFLRQWGWEVDSVALLGYAFYAAAPKPRKINYYPKNGVRTPLPLALFQQMVANARKEAQAQDGAYNENGVRRFAISVGSPQTDAFQGVLAVAQTYRFTPSPAAKDYFRLMRSALQ